MSAPLRHCTRAVQEENRSGQQLFLEWFLYKLSRTKLQALRGLYWDRRFDLHAPLHRMNAATIDVCDATKSISLIDRQSHAKTVDGPPQEHRHVPQEPLIKEPAHLGFKHCAQTGGRWVPVFFGPLDRPG